MKEVPSLLPAAFPALVPHRPQLLEGEHCVFDVGQKRQLAVPPISAYSGLPPGSKRLIAVNCKYICYSLPTFRSVCILGRNVVSRGLFLGHSQRVTDIEFFAEDVHLVASVSSDGRLFVWRIVEDVGTDDEFQLKQHIISAIQFEGPWEHVQPRVCWHPQSQECLVMCISEDVFKIDLDEARMKASHFKFSAEAFLSCHTANLIDGVLRIGHHDAEVTDLSVLFTDLLYVASASRDGTVRIWGGCKSSSLTVFIPHEGEPVGCVTFFTFLSQPDKAVLLTRDTTKKKLKLWLPATSSTYRTWYSVQTLEFTSWDGNFAEQVFLNHICTVPEAGLVLLGSSETPTIYSVHLKCGKASNAVQMNYIAEFCVSMPYLSFTAVKVTGTSCKDMAHVFCVQAKTIQEYLLDISHFLSSQSNEPGPISSSVTLLGAELANVSVCDGVEAEPGSKKPNLVAKEMIALTTAGNPGLISEHNTSNPGSGFGSWVEVPNWIAASVKKNLKVGSMKRAIDVKEKNLACCASPLASGVGAGFVESQMEEEVSFSWISRNAGNVSTQPSSLPRLRISSSELNNSKMVEDVVLPIGLVPLPCDIENLKEDSSCAVPSTFVSGHPGDTSLMVDKKQIDLSGQAKANISSQVASAVSDTVAIASVHRVDTSSSTIDQFRGPTESGSEHYKPEICTANSTVCVEQGKHNAEKESLQISSKCEEHEEEEGLVTPEMQGLSNNLKKKRTRRRNKGKNRAASMSKPNLAAEEMSLLCRTLESAMPGMPGILLEDKPHITQKTFPPSINPQTDLSVQISAMQETLDELLTSQMELQKCLYAVAEAPLFTETEGMDASVEGRINYYSGIYLDAFWRQLNDIWNDSHAVQHEWTLQIQRAFKAFSENTSASTSMLNAELLSLIGSNIGMLISSNVDDVLTTILPQSLEGWNNEVMKCIEKSLEGILYSSVREQIESILATFWKHLMQEELCSYFRQQAVLKVEQSCTNMITEGHCLSCEGLIQLTGLVEQQVSSTNLALASNLKDTMVSVLSIASMLKQELQDVERNAWINTERPDTRYNIFEELTLWLQQDRLEDAFTLALSVGSSSVTSWICKQVDLKTLFTRSRTPPLSQGVILSLVQELAVDLEHESGDKLAWMEQACLAVIPGNTQPELCMRSSLGQVYNHLQQQTRLFSTDVKLANQARLVFHLLNSLITLCT